MGRQDLELEDNAIADCPIEEAEPSAMQTPGEPRPADIFFGLVCHRSTCPSAVSQYELRQVCADEDLQFMCKPSSSKSFQSL